MVAPDLFFFLFFSPFFERFQVLRKNERMEAFSRAVFSQYCFASISARRRFYERFNTLTLTRENFHSGGSASLVSGSLCSARLGPARLGSAPWLETNSLYIHRGRSQAAAAGHLGRDPTNHSCTFILLAFCSAPVFFFSFCLFPVQDYVAPLFFCRFIINDFNCPFLFALAQASLEEIVQPPPPLSLSLSRSPFFSSSSSSCHSFPVSPLCFSPGRSRSDTNPISRSCSGIMFCLPISLRLPEAPGIK